jgi:hypothetical protein
MIPQPCLNAHLAEARSLCRRAELRASQLESLHQLVPLAHQSPGSQDCWDLALELPEGDRVTLRVFLPDTFPTDPPSMNLVEVSPLGALVQPWLDHSQHVVGCEALRAWSVKKSSLGVVGASGRCCAFAVP